MKNIFKSLLVPAFALAVVPFFASCSEDRDDNPTLRQPACNLTLTAPAGSETTTYDLLNTESLAVTSGLDRWPSNTELGLQTGLIALCRFSAHSRKAALIYYIIFLFKPRPDFSERLFFYAGYVRARNTQNFRRFELRIRRSAAQSVTHA